MSIVSVSATVNSNYAVVFLKTDDGEEHAIEFGTHQEVESPHGHHDKLHNDHNKHAQSHAKGHEHHHEGHGDGHKYHVWSPVSLSPAKLAAGGEWRAVANGSSVDVLAHALKAESGTHGGSAHFKDAASFAKYVVSEKLGAH